MGRIPHISDLVRMDDPDDDALDETQPIEPLRHQMLETDLHAEYPILDDVDCLMEHFEDTRFVRLWASSFRERYAVPKLQQPF